MPITDTIGNLLPQWLTQGQSLAHQGKLPQYIPQLAQVNPELIALGIGFKEQSIIWGCQYEQKYFSNLSNALMGEGTSASTIIADDSHVDFVLPQFPLMSIIKAFLLLYVLQNYGVSRVVELVDTNASDLAFNVIPTGKPPNPMLNCGAIALCSLLADNADNYNKPSDQLSNQQKPDNRTCQDIHRGSHKFQHWLQQIIGESITESQNLSKNQSVDKSVRVSVNLPKNLFIDHQMLDSVRSIPQRRNLAIATALEKLGLISCGVTALAIYEEICCLTTDVIGLAKLGQALLKPSPLTEFVLKVMTHCGMYAHSAEFAEDVGIPAKSAVSGAILGIVPNQAAIATYSPPLDNIGNSLGGLFLFSQVKSHILEVYSNS